MKKYIASIIILVVIIGTLTTIFMYERSVASGLPTFHLEKESGDSKKVRNVVMEGTYQQDDISQWWVKITPKETIFPQNQSFFERLDDIHAPEIRDLQKQYRSFMRGKEAYMNQLYNGKKKLIYAQFDMDDFYGDQRANSKLEISILDKQSKKSQSFETAIPDLQQYFSISVEALHPEKNHLIVLTNNNRNSTKGEIQELHAYTVDLKTEKITNDQIILQAKESEGGYTSVGFVQQDLKQPIYPLVAYEVTTKLDARGEEKILETRLFAYHFNNEKAEEIRLPKKIKKGVEIETQNGNVVYFTKRSPEQLQVFAFDISNGELKENHFTMNNQGKETDQEDSLYLKNNTLYLVDSLMDEQHQVRVRIFDAKTGEMEYKGVLKTDNGNGLTRDQTLTIDNIYTLTAK